MLKSALCFFLSQPYAIPPFTFPSYINEAFNIAKPFACKIACLFLNNCIYFNYVFESYCYCFDIDLKRKQKFVHVPFHLLRLKIYIYKTFIW